MCIRDRHDAAYDVEIVLQRTGINLGPGSGWACATPVSYTHLVVNEEGLVCEADGKPYSGLASRLHKDEEALPHISYKFRKGKKVDLSLIHI